MFENGAMSHTSSPSPPSFLKKFLFLLPVLQFPSIVPLKALANITDDSTLDKSSQHFATHAFCALRCILHNELSFLLEHSLLGSCNFLLVLTPSHWLPLWALPSMLISAPALCCRLSSHAFWHLPPHSLPQGIQLFCSHGFNCHPSGNNFKQSSPTQTCSLGFRYDDLDAFCNSLGRLLKRLIYNKKI